MAFKLITPQVPCALKSYLWKSHDPNSFAKLSHRECQIAFQDWVAYERNTSQDTFAKEHLFCPLFWCRNRFDNLGSCLHHISYCPLLADVWYWCPYCHRPEKFTACHTINGNNPTNRILRKAPRLKRAISFFKHFGRKSLVQARYSTSPPPNEDNCFPKFELDGNTHYHLPAVPAEEYSPMARHFYNPSCCQAGHNTFNDYEPYEMGNDNDDCQSSIAVKTPSWRYAELDNYNPMYTLAQLSGTPVAELSAPSHPPNISYLDTPVSSMIKGRTISTVDLDRYSVSLLSPVNSCVPPVANWPEVGSPASWMSDITLEHGTSVGHLPNMATNFALCATDTRPSMSVSGNDRSPLRSWKENYSRPNNVHHNVWQDKCNFQGGDQSLIKHASLSAVSRLVPKVDCLERSPTDHKLTPIEASVWDLRELVSTLHDDSIRRLTPSFGSSLIKARVFQPSLFETGIQVLQRFHRRVLPKTFEEAFALMQVAFACAYTYHREDTLLFWNSFYQDLLCWQHTITNIEDKLLFLKAADLIWSPPRCSHIEARQADGPLSQIRSNTPKNFLDPKFNASFSITTGHEATSYGPDSWLPQSWLDLDDLDLLRVLKSGQVISACIRYTDRIEYNGVFERNDNQSTHLTWRNIQTMQTQIINKIAGWEGVNEFRGQIDKSLSFLQLGILRNPREVELMLTVDDILDYPSPYICSEFRQIVSSFCDDVMQESGPGWRDRYHATVLDRVLAISSEVQSKLRLPGSAVGKGPGFGRALAFGEQPSSPCESPTSMSSGDSSDSTDSSATTLTSSTFLDAVGSPSNDSNTTFTPGTSPSTSPAESSSAALGSFLPSPTANLNVLRCVTCDTPFKGTPRDQYSNLQRHILNIHSQRPSLICPEPLCGKEYRRSDNLLKHRRKSHGLV